jgi:hypothetical protein
LAAAAAAGGQNLELINDQIKRVSTAAAALQSDIETSEARISQMNILKARLSAGASPEQIQSEFGNGPIGNDFLSSLSAGLRAAGADKAKRDVAAAENIDKVIEQESNALKSKKNAHVNLMNQDNQLNRQKFMLYGASGDLSIPSIYQENTPVSGLLDPLKQGVSQVGDEFGAYQMLLAIANQKGRIEDNRFLGLLDKNSKKAAGIEAGKPPMTSYGLTNPNALNYNTNWKSQSGLR